MKVAKLTDRLLISVFVRRDFFLRCSQSTIIGDSSYCCGNMHCTINFLYPLAGRGVYVSLLRADLRIHKRMKTPFRARGLGLDSNHLTFACADVGTNSLQVIIKIAGCDFVHTTRGEVGGGHLLLLGLSL